MKLFLTLGIAALLTASPVAVQPGTISRPRDSITGPGHSPPVAVVIGVTLNAADFAGVCEVTLRHVPVPPGAGTMNLTILRAGEKVVICPLPARGEPVAGLSLSQNAAVRPVVDFERRALMHALSIRP